MLTVFSSSGLGPLALPDASVGPSVDTASGSDGPLLSLVPIRARRQWYDCAALANNPTKTVKSERVEDSGLPRSGAALVLILEGRRPLAGGVCFGLSGFDSLAIGRGSERKLSHAPRAQLEIPDPKMSSRHALLERSSRGWWLRDRGATNGCLRNDELVTEALLADGDMLRFGDSFFLFRSRQLDCSVLSSEQTLPGVETLIGAHRMQLARLARVAATGISVLLRGETGTGKEVLARAIHVASGRRGPFVAVNCGAIAPTLLESQLFGHVKGAFSGAIRDEPGFFRAADHGTLFLDEIAELPLTAQATLLRVLQQSEVVPVGSVRAIPIDIRVLSATHQPLERLMSEDSFRKDLYARLSGFTHQLPPLRERREDLGLLIAALLGKQQLAHPPQLRPEVAQTFLAYDWPLNVRELEQALTAAVALSPDGVLRREDLPAAMLEPSYRLPTAAIPSPAPAGSAQPVRSAQDEALRRELVAQLRAAKGNVSATARAMNKARQQIQRWIRRLEIDHSEYED